MTIREKVVLEGEDQVSPALNRAGGNFEKLDATIKKVALAGGVVIAARKFGELAGQVTKMAVDAGEAEAAFNTTFGQALPQASRFVDEFANKAGFATYELQQMLAVTGNVVQGIGATEEESAALSESMARLAGDVASFSNAAGGAPAVLLALQSAINGEREALKTYGLAVSEAEVQERALATTRKTSADDLTRLEKANATVSIAYEKAGKAIGDLDRTQDSAANSLRRVGARLKEAGVEAGDRLLPALEALLPKIEDSIPALTDAAIATAEFVAAVAGAAPVEKFADILDGVAISANSLINVGATLGASFAELFTFGQADTSGIQGMADFAAHANDVRSAVRALREEQVPGTDAAARYGNALAQVQRDSFLSEDALERLSAASGATAEEQYAAIRTLQEYGREHGYTAEEMALLSNAAISTGLEIGVLAEDERAAAHNSQLLTAATTETTGAIEEVPDASQEAADAILDMADAARDAGDAFRADLLEEANDFLTGFEKLPKRIKISMDAFEANFTDRTTTLSDFWTNLATLAEAGLGHLAEQIRAQGPEAAGLLDDLVGDMDRAAELDDVIRTAGTEMENVTGEYADALERNGDSVLTPLGEFGQDMIEAIAEGIDAGDLAGPLLRKVRGAVSALIGSGALPSSPSSGTERDGRLSYDTGTWAVPGGPGRAVAATLHGTEIVIPPEGTGGRAQFARELAVEMGRMGGGNSARGPISVQVSVTVPPGTSVYEAVAAAAAQGAIEAVMN